MTDISISVAMCTFDGERFLGAQLDSIAAQSRPPSELVVCDDGSSDRSLEIIRNFARCAPFPTRLELNEINLGSTKNFEQAISLCRGEIVALADQDDIWYPHKLQKLEEAFLRSSNIVAAFSDADLIDSNSRSVGLRLWPTFFFNSEEQNQFASGHALSVLIKHPVVTGATMAFRREFFDVIAPIPANEIHDRWIAFLLAAGGRIEMISEPLMQYRQHQSQQMGPGPLTLREQTAHARSTGVNSYLEEIERFHQLYDRIGKDSETFPYATPAQNEIKKKIGHLEHRARLPRARIARISKVIREWFRGGYWRYSSGWKSVAKDLLIR